jgi:lipid-binding SYLF domain-containing protein
VKPCCLLPIAALVLLAMSPDQARAQGREGLTVESSRTVLNEIATLPTKAIPATLLREAHGVAVIPGVIKAGFVVGGRFGRGVVIVRDEAGNWRPPVFITLTGGSVGWQIGAQSSDVVLVFKSQRGVDGILNGNKFTLGGDLAVAAGPVGRQAEASTDLELKAEIYSYARSRGLFAGVSLEGSALSVDDRADAAYYGAPGISAGQIVAGENIQIPESAIRLLETLSEQTAAADAGLSPVVR